MATGYTECVASGEVTDLREFIARSFNNNADDPRIVKCQDGIWRYKKETLVISYWENQMAEEKKQLQWFESASVDQLADAANKEWLRACQSVHERTENDQEKIKVRSRYDAMKEKLKEWQNKLPHEGLLAFSRGLMDQLESSIKFDCGDRLPNPEKPVLATPLEFKEASISTCRQMIKHYESIIAERKKEYEHRNDVYNCLCRYLNNTQEGDFSLLTSPAL